MTESKPVKPFGRRRKKQLHPRLTDDLYQDLEKMAVLEKCSPTALVERYVEDSLSPPEQADHFPAVFESFKQIRRRQAHMDKKLETVMAMLDRIVQIEFLYAPYQDNIPPQAQHQASKNYKGFMEKLAQDLSSEPAFIRSLDRYLPTDPSLEETN